MGTEEGLVGDRECLWDTGLGSVRYSSQGATGDSSGDKACMLPPGTSGSYGMNGSGSKGSTSSIGLSGSSSGFSTGGGSWYISIEEYSQRWMFQGMGTRGSTGGWSRGDDSLDGSLGGSGGRSGRGDGFNGNGCLGIDRVTRRGSDEDEKNWGGS